MHFENVNIFFLFFPQLFCVPKSRARDHFFHHLVVELLLTEIITSFVIVIVLVEKSVRQIISFVAVIAYRLSQRVVVDKL